MKATVKKLISWSLMVMFVGGVLGPVQASELTKKQGELNKIRQQKKALNRKKDATKERRDLLVGQLDGIKTEIDQLDAEINNDETKLKLAKKKVQSAILEYQLAEQDLQEQSEILADRVRDIYINGRVSYLEVLMQSESFADFINRFEMMRIIVEKDAQLLEEVEEQKAQIKAKKEQLEVERNHVATVLESKEQKMENVQVKQEQYDEMLDQAKKDLVAYEEEIARIEELESKKVAEVIRLQQPKNSKSRGSGVYAWPTPGHERVTSGFGWRMHPILKTRKMHTGVDIGAPSGAKVVAAQNGTVIFSGWMNGYGNVVILDHGAGVSTLYAHLSARLAEVGQEFSKGDTIAKVGSTGRSTGPHLHFEVRKDGEPINPMSYI